jgi:hypothetical protein
MSNNPSVRTGSIFGALEDVDVNLPAHGDVVLQEDPSFPQYGGVWLGVPRAQTTDANAVLEASADGDVFLNAGRTNAGPGPRSINLEFDGGTMASDSVFIAQRTAAPGNVVEMAFFGKSPQVPQQTLAGILASIAAVADPNAKAALTQILDALVAYGLVVAT